MAKQFFKLFLTLILSFALTQCGGVTGGLGLLPGDGDGIESEGDSGLGNEGDSGGSDNGGSSEPGEEGALPPSGPISLPSPPSLTSDFLLAYAPNTYGDSQHIPFIGSAGAATYEEGHRVLVSRDDPSETALLKHPVKTDSLVAKLLWKLTPSQHTILPFVSPAMADDTDPCLTVGNYCYTIQEDGSFEAYLLGLTTEEYVPSFYTAVVSDEGVLSEVTTETVIPDILWFQENPLSLSSTTLTTDDSTHALALTTGKGLELKETDGQLSVIGEIASGYEKFAATSATKLMADDDSVLVMKPTAGIDARATTVSGSDRTLVPADAVVVSDEALERYEVLKICRDGVVRFGGLFFEETALVYREPFAEVVNSSIDERIIIDLDSVDSEGELFVRRIVSFDKDENGNSVVLYQDQYGTYRIHLVNDPIWATFRKDTKFEAADSSFILRGFDAVEFDGLDIIKPTEVAADPVKGYFLTYDKRHQKIWLFDFSILADDLTFDISEPEALSLNENSSAYVLSPDYRYLYVLAGSTLERYTLKDEGGAVNDMTTIQTSKIPLLLEEFIEGKDIELDTNHLAYHSIDRAEGADRIIVGSAGLRGGLVVPAIAFDIASEEIDTESLPAK